MAFVRHTLRSLGLESANTLTRSRNAPESSKPVIRKSRWLALNRCLIHIVPICLFSFLIFLNYETYYIGPGFSYTQPDALFLLLFQVAAKLLEIACVASLTTVVTHVLRQFLLKDGLPFGLVGSGISFGSITSLWSPGMIAGVLNSRKEWKRIGLIIILVTSTVLATLIGPSSAVLLQPRVQTIPSGGTEYYLPVSAKQLWPSQVDASNELELCSGLNATQYAVCPSGGFEALHDYYQNFNWTFTQSDALQVKASDAMEDYGILVQSRSGLIPPMLNSGIIRGLSPETAALQAHGLTALIQQSLSDEWRVMAARYNEKRMSSKAQFKFAKQVISTVTTTSPMTRVSCTGAQNLSADRTNPLFPVKGSRSFHSKDFKNWEDSPIPLSVPDMNKNVSDELQVQWVPMPSKGFGPVSGGVIVQFPWEDTGHSRAVIACTICATWEHDPILSDTTVNNGAWHFETMGRVDLKSSQRDLRDDLNASSPLAASYERLVTINSTWFDVLTPQIQQSPNSTRTISTIEKALNDIGFDRTMKDLATLPRKVVGDNGDCVWVPALANATDTDRFNTGVCGGNKEIFLEMIFASLVVDGLSRYQTHTAYDIPKDPDAPMANWILKSLPKAPSFSSSILSVNPSENAISAAPAGSDYVKQKMKAQIAGYAWFASETSDYLATVCVGVYMLVVALHTIWVLSKGVTGTAWDSVIELVALALQSPQVREFDGVGAGIERLATYRKLVRIEAIESDDTRASEKVVLVVAKSDGAKTSATEDQGYAYGAVDQVEQGGETKSHLEDDTPKTHMLSPGVTTTSQAPSTTSTIRSASERSELRLRKVVVNKLYT